MLTFVPALARAAGPEGEIPLHSAARGVGGDVPSAACAEALLACEGVDVNATDVAGLCPLHYAANAGHEHVIRLLLMHGARTGASAGSAVRRTALQIAARGGYAGCVRALLDAGADPSVPDDVRSIRAASRAIFGLALSAEQSTSVSPCCATKFAEALNYYSHLVLSVSGVPNAHLPRGGRRLGLRLLRTEPRRVYPAACGRRSRREFRR